jgi:hypothetical protein
MQKLDKPVELEGRIILYKPIAKLKKKSQKMKGGVVEILGEGTEGIVLRPNINNLENNNKVSKLITATAEQIIELIAFEEELNRIDRDGIYHVKMLGYRDITEQNINRIQGINQPRKNEMKKYNFKITYQFGGISIEEFVINLQEGKETNIAYINSHFVQALLRGILNCFYGIYVFYYEGISHNDLHGGNIVFFLNNPILMRTIDWGIFLPEIQIVSNNNFMQGSAANSNNLNQRRMKKSLLSFCASIRELFTQIKRFTNENNIKILNFFLELLHSVRERILNERELESLRNEMETLIKQIS